jgi:hypothetical protein
MARRGWIGTGPGAEVCIDCLPEPSFRTSLSTEIAYERTSSRYGRV